MFLMLVLIAPASLTAQELIKEEIPGIRNYTQVNATVACAGATTLEALEEVRRRQRAARGLAHGVRPRGAFVQRRLAGAHEGVQRARRALLRQR
ncbi:MAG: hypothetical protein VX992_01355, partial [Acidobacteriota bacterium]|nr:hypothetical protein [Acidobacteriota bacterium]